MKKIKYFSLIALVFCIVSVSCKKSSSDTGSATTPSPILGKWNLDSVQYVASFNNQTIYNTYYKSTVDYYDFRNDGKVYILVNSTKDTANYTFVNGANGKQYIQYNIFTSDTIVTLSSSKLIFLSYQGATNQFFFHK